MCTQVCVFVLKKKIISEYNKWINIDFEIINQKKKIYLTIDFLLSISIDKLFPITFFTTSSTINIIIIIIIDNCL